MDTNLKVLVLGSSGFVGSNLVKRLQEQGYFVFGADVKKPEYIEPNMFFQVDLRDSFNCEELFKACKGFDRVYQLAAWMGGAGVIFTGDNDSEVMHDSALINLNVANYATKHGIKQLFFSSSVCAYAKEQVANKIPEEAIYPANPDSNYGWEKIFSERVYEAFHKNKGLNIRIARFNNCFGPYCTWDGGREKSPAAICRKALIQDPIEIWGDGKQVREFIYIDDLLDAVEIIMQSSYTGPTNIGPDESYAIDEMVRMVSDKEIKHIDGPIGLQVRLTDNTKIKSLGWLPKVPIQDGMLKLKEWIQDQMMKNQKIENKNKPLLSIVLPIHEMENGAFFLWRLVDSLSKQTFKNYELIITKDGKMAENANSAIKKAKGEIIKVMQLDDYFYDENSLQDIVDTFTPDTGWVISGCIHTFDGETLHSPHFPQWNDSIYTGNNTLGGLSTLSFRRDSNLLFEEPLTWVVDCDLYQRLYEKYGEPKFISPLNINVVVQGGSHQTTNKLTMEEKNAEHEYVIARYETNNYISQNYKLHEKTPSDINEHLGTLKRISANCRHITELGVRRMLSSWAFLEGMRPRGGKLVSVDIKNPSEYGGYNVEEAKQKCAELGVDFQFIQGNSLEVALEDTDLLFIDTIHLKDHLKKELELHTDKAKKYIVFHDTESSKDELMPVIDGFLKNNKQWRKDEVWTHNNGLTILKHE